MIGTPHQLHTHRRSSLYIYNALQHLLQWLVVIRILPHPNMASGGMQHHTYYHHSASVNLSRGGGFSLKSQFLAQMMLLCNDIVLSSTSYSYQIHFIHIKGVWHTSYEVGTHDTHMSVSSLLHYHHSSLGQVWCMQYHGDSDSNGMLWIWPLNHWYLFNYISI